MSATATPAAIRRAIAIRRIIEADREISQANANPRWMRQRRADTRAHGYRGPLTRKELAEQAARRAADEDASRTLRAICWMG